MCGKICDHHSRIFVAVSNRGHQSVVILRMKEKGFQKGLLVIVGYVSHSWPGYTNVRSYLMSMNVIHARKRESCSQIEEDILLLLEFTGRLC